MPACRSIPRAHPLAAIALAAALAAGCASTPEATPERDADAKRFDAATRDSVVYVYRDDFAGSGGATTLLLDGRVIGDSLPGTYFRLYVLAGRHRLSATGPDMGSLDFETRVTQTTYVALRVHGGADGAPTSALRVVPAAEAQAVIARCCRLLEAWKQDQPRLMW